MFTWAKMRWECQQNDTLSISHRTLHVHSTFPPLEYAPRWYLMIDAQTCEAPIRCGGQTEGKRFGKIFVNKITFPSHLLQHSQDIPTCGEVTRRCPHASSMDNVSHGVEHGAIKKWWCTVQKQQNRCSGTLCSKTRRLHMVIYGHHYCSTFKRTARAS